MAPERGESGPGEDSTGVVPAHSPAHCPQVYIKEGDGAVDPPLAERPEDDDLTSLTWLQDKNLLKGINLRTPPTGATKEESPTSDYTEECASEQGESTCSSVTSSSPIPPPTSCTTPPVLPLIKNKHPHHIPYDPKIHITSKPPYSFSCLIFMSIEDSKGKALPVKEIYTWILEHFPYYRNAPTGWKNSVRHNLSLNKCFRKVDKAPRYELIQMREEPNFGRVLDVSDSYNSKCIAAMRNLGKGSLWMVDPIFRPNLVQALMKAPYHPYTNLDKTNSAPHFRRSPAPVEIRNDADGSEDEAMLDDVDAAAAMLVLKHGPHARFHFRDEYHKRHKLSFQNALNGKRIKDDDYVSRHSEDHTYSSQESTLEPDEAFMDGSDSNSTCSLHIYEEDTAEEEDPEEERRKTAEGADALLNLAGITTSGPPLVGGRMGGRKRRPAPQHRAQAKVKR